MKWEKHRKPPQPPPEVISNRFELAATVVFCAFLLYLCLRWLLNFLQLRSLNAKYMKLAEEKRLSVAATLEHARAAGLDWEGCLKWASSHQTLHRKASTGGPPLREPSEVLKLTASELLEEMQKGRLTSEYVTRCFVGRAIAISATLNCVAENCFEAAVADARACDVERASGTLRGPLHGLPISIKEQYRMTGFHTTCGTCCRLTQPPSSGTALIVSNLQASGAIPFCRTNVPQLCMLPETFNAIYGTTHNPYDLTRTPGGSTGGESALIAARASPLGMGTDVGGSVRIPAFFTGTCALKPTVDRLSTANIAVPRRDDQNGQKEVRSCPGPMGRSVADLELAMRTICTEEMHAADCKIPPIPWDHEAYERVASRGAAGGTVASPKAGGKASGKNSGKNSAKAGGNGGAASSAPLRFGYYESDGWFQAAAPCARAVREAADALRAAGHEVVAFPPEEMAEAAVCYVALLSADGGFRGFLEGIEGEALHPNYSFLCRVASLPSWLRPPLAWVLKHVLGQTSKSVLVRAGGGKSTHEYWQWIVQRDKLKHSLLYRMRAERVDALLCPGLGLPAFPHNASVLLNMACSYAFVYNLFNFPCGVLPVTTVRDDEQTYDGGGDLSFQRAAHAAMQGSAGLPVGVQVVTEPWREEQCLGAMRVLEQALGRVDPMPRAPMGLQ